MNECNEDVMYVYVYALKWFAGGEGCAQGRHIERGVRVASHFGQAGH